MTTRKPQPALSPNTIEFETKPSSSLRALGNMMRAGILGCQGMKNPQSLTFMACKLWAKALAL